MPAKVYEFEALDIQGKLQSLNQYAGQVILIVNVASKCGHTKQYAGLEALYNKYKDRGLVILGFPCNQFGGQEPGTDAEIQEFCSVRFGVSFPLFSKIKVNGPEAHPLFAYLKEQAPGEEGRKPIKWNFTKFIVNREGQVMARYFSKQTPDILEEEILRLL